MSPLERFKPIEWMPSMTTGVDAIDNQHQYLMGTLKEANYKPLGTDDDFLLSQFAKDLLGYAITHFETEESLMQRYGYAAARPKEATAHIA